MGYMTKENLGEFAFVNTDTLKGEIKGVCINFHGFTDATMLTESPEFARLLGEKGILYIFPYFSVWAWFDKSSQKFIEEVLDTVWETFGLDENIPLVAAGGSMGGMTALLYGLYGKRKITACAGNCPVTDIRKHMKHGVIRAIYSAYILEDIPFEKWLEMRSPVLLAEDLPDIPYYTVFGSCDTAVTQEEAEPFIDAMKKAGRNICSVTVSGMGHCCLADFKDELQKYADFVINSVNNSV